MRKKVRGKSKKAGTAALFSQKAPKFGKGKADQPLKKC